MSYIDGLPTAPSVNDDDLLVIDQGGSGVPGSGTTYKTPVLSVRGTGGLVPIAARSLLANPTGAVALPAAVTLTNGLNFSGVTLGFNPTAATGGIQFNGAPFITQSNVAQGSTVIGTGAGAALPTGSIFSTFVGYNAGARFTGATGEATLIGTLSGQFLIDGSFATAVGENAMGQEVHAVASTAIGNDSQRSYVSATGGNTSVGKNSMAFGGGVNNTAVGTQALRGNAASALFTGSATAGDVITLTFTGPFVGSPQAASITVTPGQTTSQMATAMVAAIAAIPAIQTVALNGNLVNAFANLLQFGNYGTATTGSSVVITAGVTGSATETVTIGGGAIGQNNAAFGYLAMQGLAMTSATENAGFGTNSLTSLTSGTSNVGLGSSAGVSITSGINNVLAGRLAGSSLTTTNATTALGFQALLNQTVGGNVAIGNSAGQAVTVGIALVLVGASAGINLTNGSGNTAIGDNAMAGAASSTGSLCTAVGQNALQLISSANQCVAIGRNAGSKITGGSLNTIIGHNVASTTLQTGSNNILIGIDSSTDTATASTSNTAIIKGGTGGTAILSSTGTNATPTTIMGGLLGTSATTGITAHAGGTQALATPLTTGGNLIATCATANDSVRLPVSTIPGIHIIITNNGAASAQLYGAGTDTINGAATATGVAIAPGKTWYGHAPAAGTWFGGTLA